jgi:hypothetical protein
MKFDRGSDRLGIYLFNRKNRIYYWNNKITNDCDSSWLVCWRNGLAKAGGGGGGGRGGGEWWEVSGRVRARSGASVTS